MEFGEWLHPTANLAYEVYFYFTVARMRLL